MADNIFSFIPGMGGGSGMNWPVIALWTLIIIIFVAMIWGFIFFLIFKKKYFYTVEIDLLSKQIRTITSKIESDFLRKTKAIWLPKYKKKIPMIQQDSMYFKKSRDATILIRDNNGLHHPLRMMNKDELIDYYRRCKGIDITQEFQEKSIIDLNGNKTTVKIENPYYKNYEVYAMPNPHEDLDFLGDECENANREYKSKTPWYLSPTVMVIATAFICMIMFIVTIILLRK